MSESNNKELKEAIKNHSLPANYWQFWFLFGNLLVVSGLLAVTMLKVTYTTIDTNDEPTMAADHTTVETDSDENHEVISTIEVTKAACNSDPSPQ